MSIYRKAIQKLTWHRGRSVLVLSVLTFFILGIMLYIEWAISNIFKPTPHMRELYMMFPDSLVFKAPMLFFDFSPFEIHQALISAYGKHGRKLYVLFRAIDHALFPMVLAATLLSANRILSPHAKGGITTLGEILPMALFAGDICENSGLIYLLAVFEETDEGDAVKEKVAMVTLIIAFLKTFTLILELLFLLWLVTYHRCCAGGKAKKKAE